MAGVLDGVKVLDLAWGIAGPMTGMLMADHGAEVTKIEPPGGDPYRKTLSGYKVWHRGKRSAEIDLKDEAQREKFLKLVDGADVLIESFAPGVAAELGLDYDTLSARNPRLIYLSLTAYGHDTKDAGRPGYDALVAARTGHNFESRGIPGGTIPRLAGQEGALPGLEVPDECWVGAPRQGPLFGGVPWPSMASFYLASVGVNAALRAREITGKGQQVHTSLLQGVLATTIGAWLRVERPETPNFQSWVSDPRAPKGFFRCKDGRWVHNWVPLPSFVLGVSEGDKLEITENVSGPKAAGMRIGLNPEDMVILHAYQEPMAEAFKKFPSNEWSDIAAEVGVPVQVVRSPEEALQDELLVADGCVAEIDDPEEGRIRGVGQVYTLSACDQGVGANATVGQHTAEVLAEAETTTPQQATEGRSLEAPLAGIKVLDLGLAVAGPFGTQVLAQLGAEVIKVNTLFDGYWLSNHIGMCCNRDKKSISLNLKDPNAMEILLELVAEVDIVQHNMRYDAAVRLGVDYESLKKINPSLIYCHTRGFEHGPRNTLPGNDQTGAALAGTDWLEGGCDFDGKPIWPVVSLGDTGNGFLSAVAMIQALYHRDRTGEGQFCDTSIIYAHMLNCSTAWTTVDGSKAGERQQLDNMQLGWSPTYRLYETSDERFVCVAAFSDDEVAALGTALGVDTSGDRDGLAAVLEPAFAAITAEEAFAKLDGAGVPAEIANENYVLDLFDDPEMIEKGWVTAYQHPTLGKMEVFGNLIDFSDTPGKMWGPPILAGQHSREILEGLGMEKDQIDKLIAENVVGEPA